MKNVKLGAVLFALLAAVFYALNTPFSKLLLAEIPATMMAAFLYLGAGIGVGIMYCFHWKKEDKKERLTKKDLPYTIGVVSQILCKRRFRCKTEQNIFKAGAAASSSCLVYKIARLRGHVKGGGASLRSSRPLTCRAAAG